ncbi:LuxR C-terminal-related transcriptional regulator [Leifsonia shinshuensis]|uniref:LuxR family maltose regulon positive regulatory protein n=1 Tax=Leifsonia shinshuensis TaxID=150026 RepID=A0A853CVA4_9MICO|nr:LuxR C-terminal-related transcriptional regulator [Leifsonia shinshuensis]NYJ22505.1 LuxR family maltose regulon positive regulatory protein [Leifsonia shinshuensis]
MTTIELRDAPTTAFDDGGAQRGLPRLSRYTIERTALSERLDRGLREQATVVRAPAGYGKTSLVRKWLERPGGSRWAAAAWIDLDVVTGETRGFWDACRTVLDPQEASAGWDTDPEAAAQDAIGRRGGTVVLVLDGYSRRWDGLMTSRLVHLLRRTPNLHLVVLTRALTAFEAPALAAILDLVVVQNDDLAFDRDELDEVARAIGLDVEHRILDHVWRQSRGWPLAARAMVRLFDDPRSALAEPVAARALDEIMDTVVTELLAQAPDGDEGRLGLQRASVAPYLDPHIVERIGADAAADGVLAVAESAGLGVWTYARGQGRLVYELLDAVRTVLRAELDAASPGEGDRLAAELLDVLEANGDSIAALRQALRTNDLAAAETIVARNWTSAFSDDAAEYLQELGAIELGALRSSVILLTVTGLLRENAGAEPAAALELYHAAAEPQALRGRRLDPVRQYWTDLASMVALRKVGRLAHADDFLSALSTPDPSVPVPPLAWLEMGLTQLRLGREQESITSFERCAIGVSDDPDLYLFASGAAALAYALHGELDRAKTVADRLRSFVSDDRKRLPRALAPLAIARRLIETERAPFAASEAEGEARAGREPRDETHIGELHSYRAYASALRALATGELEEAQRIIDAELLSKGSHTPSNSESARFVALSADLLMSQGNLVAAQKLIKVFPDGTNALRPVSARLLLMFREYRSAQLLAEAVLAEGAGPRTRVEMLLVQAEALQRLKSARATAIRLNARQLAEANALLTPFVLTIEGQVAPLLPASAAEADGVEAQRRRIKPLFSEAAMAAQLTQRERIVLDRLQSTASLEYIARSLVVSINTVKTQTRSIYRKLGANSREEAVRIAYDLGLLRPRLPIGKNRYEGDDRIA